ncbi:FAD-binding domain-containing protein [Ophiobolus disseminans]|uniref:FAD-binding domain-containing protein n=1 Tax=Ophiobolus disseminans TaxID=1469910 RepID=A0A6A6ZMJ0_9PLEO|nr:FAD-binding domain-containing protein [Ophiobolus disseminans]
MAPTRSFILQVVSSLLYLSPEWVLAQTSPGGIATCLQGEGLQFSTSSDTTWTTATAALQLRVLREPSAVVFAQDRDDIVAALSCARNASVKVSTVNRGHSFQGYAFGTPGNLVIDLKNFTALSFDASTNELTVGGGTNVGPTAKYLWDNHHRHFPHVRGSHVGMLGSMMGGGFGTTTRMFGSPMDNLASVEYMLANGSLVTAGAGSDLLWAAQGAGPSFGIALSAKIRTHAIVHDGALNYTISLGSDPSIDTVASALLRIQEFALDNQLPDELSLRFMLGNAQSVGYFYGQEAAFDRAMTPLLDSLRSIAPNVTLRKNVLASFWESEVISTGIGMNSPTGGTLGAGRFMHIQSWVATSDNPLSAKQASSLFESHRSRNRTDLTNSGFLDLWAGTSLRTADSDTSLHQGKNLWLIRVDGVGNGSWPTDGVSYMQNLMRPFTDSLRVTGPLRSFVNYADSDLDLDEWSAMLYGSNFARLQEIKAAMDPSEMFSGYGHAIPLPSRAW